MVVKNTIIQKIKNNVFAVAPITDKSNLYTDLCFDSLSFAVLLSEIENEFSITFDITEMEACLQIEQLITIVENKIDHLQNSDDIR